MRFAAPLVPGTLLRRYKRFLADIVLEDGREVVAHCANPGSMWGLGAPGCRVWLQPARDPKRKLAFDWELVEADLPGGPQLVAINTGNPNRIAAEAIAAGAIAPLAGYASIAREVRYGAASRVDFVLNDPGRPPCYVEVKNVHMMRDAGLAEFPDCVTARGARHLDELARERASGHRAVMLFVIQMRADRFTLAADVDPTYAARFAAAVDAGVEALAYACVVTPAGVSLDRAVPVVAPVRS